jgi:arginase family enzyme
MAKVDPERLAHYQSLDRGAFEFSNDSVQAFFERAAEQGYALDPEAFHEHPGFFQAPRATPGAEVDIGMLGCPCDLGAIGLAGTRHGPRAVRERSRYFGPYHDVSGAIPFEQCRIADLGDVEFTATNLGTRVAEDIYGFAAKSVATGAATLSCGGEHTTTFGLLKAHALAHDDSLSVLHIDAHSDTMATWGGDAVNDGSIFRQAVLNGYIDPQRTIQIGIRGRSNLLWEFAADTGMTVISADEVWERGVADVLAQVREVVGNERTYLSFDVDGLDSSYMMGTTGPEPFGLSPRQVRDLILGARGLNLVGADMVEFNPNRDPNQMGAHVATGLFWELLCLLADTLTRRGNHQPTEWR